MPNQGIPEAKFDVPSKGSTIHVYSELFDLNPVSSAIMLCLGNSFCIIFTIAFSDAKSALVTMLLWFSFTLYFWILPKLFINIFPEALSDFFIVLSMAFILHHILIPVMLMANPLVDYACCGYCFLVEAVARINYCLYIH